MVTRVVMERELEPLEEEHDFSMIAESTSAVRRESEKAVLLLVEGGESWFPRTVLREDERGRIWAADWFLRKEGHL